MKIVITGGSGKLGRSLKKEFPKASTPSHKDFDISNRKMVFDYIKKEKPDIVIHTAALTGIRQCDDDKNLAWKINVSGTENILDALNEFNENAYFIYISTACVFNGEGKPKIETDTPEPKNYYSLTKLCGELISKKYKNHLIIRTNFVEKTKWMYPKAFSDRYGTYLFADDVAKGIKEIMEKKMNGIVHLCGDKRMSMLELARITSPGVQPMAMKEYSGPPLTIDMSLDTIFWKKYKISN